MKFLLTAFQPFGGRSVNSSLEGCRAYMAQHDGDFDLQFVDLPVVYGEDVAIVESVLNAFPADVILHTGESTTGVLRLERRGRNRRYPDTDSMVSAIDVPILEGGPEYLYSSIPVDELMSKLTEASVSVESSQDAGIYLCNHALYRSLHRELRSSTPRQVGFLHVPVESYVSPETTAKAIYVIVEELERRGTPRV